MKLISLPRALNAPGKRCFRMFFTIMLAVLLDGCFKHSEHHHDDSQEVAGAVSYMCPMHPHVVQEEPGKCPVCGMDLVPKNSIMAHEKDLMLTDSQMRLANITTQRIRETEIGQTVLVNGRLAVNQDLTEVISSRVSGRIERLFVKETGRIVRRGEPLYQIYSEVLFTLQKEFMLAKEQHEAFGEKEQRYKSFLDAARRKLLLYGMTESQVTKLAETGVVGRSITFVAPASGVVRDLNVVEGQYIEEGTLLMRLEQIKQLWIEAELYPTERSLVSLGDKITMRIPGSERGSVEATVQFLSPQFRANSQVTVMRASLENEAMLLAPGMQVQVSFTHSGKKAIVLPADAVIRDGKGSHVYVQRGRNTFRPKMVETGIEDFDRVEITKGLAGDDTVAVTGAYLLYSEVILKRGVHPIDIHQH